MLFARSMSRAKRVFVLRMVVGIEMHVAVGVYGFSVNKGGDRSIFLSCCFCVKKIN